MNKPEENSVVGVTTDPDWEKDKKRAEEKELVEAAKKGNLVAFEKILYAYEKPIFSYVYRLVRQKEEAEDLTQETFVKLYQHIDAVDVEKNFRAWVYKIATNTVYDWLRKKQKRQELFIIDDPNVQYETIDTQTPYQDMQRVERAKDVEAALEKVRPVYRAVLLLFYWQGFGYTEIAHVLSLPLNTVKTYLYRAKHALKQELAQTYYS
jgi:RNA polymerase sigma-70 factor, ECF subfamily